MRLKLVVLPAPFGPIRATISPSLIAKLKSCTARNPPNRRLMLRRTSTSAIERQFFRTGTGAPRSRRRDELIKLTRQHLKPSPQAYIRAYERRFGGASAG